MNSPLDILWASFDTELPVYDDDFVQTWPPGVFDWLLATGLIEASDQASHIACPSCPDRHVEEVIVRQKPDGTSGYFIPCPETHRVQIPADLLRQWQPNFKLLARRVKELLNIAGRATEPIEGRLWRIGAAQWARKSREMYMARGLGSSDGATLLARCAGQSRPVVFIGLVPPPAEVLLSFSPVLVPLPSVMNVSDGELHLDHELLAQRIAECDKIVGVKGGIDFEELRRWVAQCVDQCMAEGPVLGLIAAGLSQGLSTRKIEADLTERGIPMDHATVARRIVKAKKGAIADGIAPSTQSVLRHGSSQPRDSRNRPIADAQPEED